MNNNQIAEAIAAHEGILAVLVTARHHQTADLELDAGLTLRAEKGGLEDPRSILFAAYHLFDAFNFTEPLRINAGESTGSHTISCYCHGEKIAVVLSITGHRVQKSLRRMAQRCLVRKVPLKTRASLQPEAAQ